MWANVIHLSQNDAMRSLVALQEFDGSFELTATLTGLIGVSADAVHGKLSTFGASDTIVATAVAVAYFQTKLAHLQDDWQLVVSKV